MSTCRKSVDSLIRLTVFLTRQNAMKLFAYWRHMPCSEEKCDRGKSLDSNPANISAAKQSAPGGSPSAYSDLTSSTRKNGSWPIDRISMAVISIVAIEAIALIAWLL